MALFQKGNEYYLIRSKDGRDTTYTPESLLDKANQYFQWCIDNPLKEQVIQKRKISRDEEAIEKHTIEKLRPFTIQGFCIYAGIVEKTFWNYSKRNEFLQVTTRIRDVIENQQFEGAASGFLNANIIARKLGLTDKKEISGNPDNPLKVITGMEIK